MTSRQLTHIINDVDSKMLGVLANPKKYMQYRKIFFEASNFIKRPVAPVHIDIELSNICNYTCSFCVHGMQEKKKYYDNKIKLPKEKVFEILDEAVLIGIKSVQFNVINEPLLYNDLIEVLEYAAKLGFDDIFFISNGSMLNKEISKKLIKSGLTKLMISLDAFSKESYLKVRQSKKYNQVVQNILDFLEIRKKINFKLPLVRVSFLINDLNKHEAGSFENFWKNKADFVAFQNLINLSNNADNEKFDNIDKLSTYRCNMPNFRITVKADGTVKPCCTFYGDELKFGNLYESKIQDICLSKKWIDFQDMHEKYEWQNHIVCKRCITNTNIIL